MAGYRQLLFLQMERPCEKSFATMRNIVLALNKPVFPFISYCYKLE